MKIANNEILKGFTLFTKDYLIGINWFVMPLIPYKNSIVLDIGERLRDSKGRDLFNVQDSNIEELRAELKEIIQEKTKVLDIITCIEDFYNYFYVNKNTEKLPYKRNVHSNNNPRHIERLIYLKGYLGIDFVEELEQLYKLIELSNRKPAYYNEIKSNVDTLQEYSRLGSSQLLEHLKEQKQKTIQDLKLKKLVDSN